MLCHGLDGLGEGFLAIKMKNYPSANLLTNIKASSRKDIRKAIFFGGALGNISAFMPPYGEAIDGKEVDALVELIQLMRRDTQQSSRLIKIAYNKTQIQPNVNLGKLVYSTRCVLCHGKTGQGDGRMSEILKSPSPANLVKSQKPDDYLYQIISQGGESIGRSAHMPPWGDQLTDREINSLVIFLKHLRQPSP